jgi:ribosome-associated heat shock protein Hsp15
MDRSASDALVVRLDKWLWAARFFKTRSLAQEAVEQGRVRMEGERVKPARVIRIADTVQVTVGDLQRVVVVRGLSDQRGSASIAQRLYEETAESVAARQAQRERNQLQAEPAQSIHGRPTKRDRRALERARG